ncbi:hypothetical protein OH810_30620 (plasmid) [Streptomyces albidoflavus]|uniref:hypothetical protein n=1 Tax=Streptomyces albidoflavus TaxID=1886 RepID=UPI002F910917|nr:hypothetical protein OH810_30620 [Streptomyces albidoflavus]
MVDDVVNQLHKAAHSPLEDVRARTRPEDCHGGPTFADARITADADLAADGLLLDFKSTRHPLKETSQRTAWQLAGYLLLDAADAYRIDAVGLYLTRTGVLASWPVEDFLDLLGACRRDLTELRTVFAELLTGCHGHADASFTTQEEVDHVRRLLERLAPVAAPGSCPVCPQPLPEATRHARKFCTSRCRERAKVLRNRGLMPGGPRPLIPGPPPAPRSPRRRVGYEPHSPFPQVDAVNYEAVRRSSRPCLRTPWSRPPARRTMESWARTTRTRSTAPNRHGRRSPRPAPGR